MKTLNTHDMKLRIVWDYEELVDLSHLQQWDTPEKYKKAEVFINGELLSFEEYIKFYGNPERHVVLFAVVQQCCVVCGEWKEVSALGNIDFMDTDSLFIGTVTTENITNKMKGTQLSISQELLTEVLRDI